MFSMDPDVMGGQLCVAGTRITVAAIAIRLEAGETIEDLADDYPYVPEEVFRIIVSAKDGFEPAD